jgi:hypothetical protein
MEENSLGSEKDGKDMEIFWAAWKMRIVVASAGRRNHVTTRANDVLHTKVRGISTSDCHLISLISTEQKTRYNTGTQPLPVRWAEPVS